MAPNIRPSPFVLSVPGFVDVEGEDVEPVHILAHPFEVEAAKVPIAGGNRGRKLPPRAFKSFTYLLEEAHIIRGVLGATTSIRCRWKLPIYQFYVSIDS